MGTLNRMAMLLLPLSLSLWHRAGTAQEYPQRSVRIVVGFAAGSGLDLTTRLVGQRLSASWGQPVIIDNRAGAAGTVAATIVAKAAPDGYTLLNAATAHVVSALLNPELAYDFVKDLTPITRLGTTPYLMAVNLMVPANSVQEFIALAKSRPGKLNYGSSGNGTVAHLAGEMLKLQAGIYLVHIPYKGANLVVADMLGGQVDMMFNTFASLLHFVKAGKLRGLGVASPKRTVWLPEVPTMAEAGLPDLEAENWHGYAAPAGTPQPVIDRIYRDIARIVDTSEARERLLAMGLVPDTTAPTPEQFGAMIKRDLARYATAIKAAGATAR